MTKSTDLEGQGHILFLMEDYVDVLAEKKPRLECSYVDISNLKFRKLKFQLPSKCKTYVYYLLGNLKQCQHPYLPRIIINVELVWDILIFCMNRNFIDPVPQLWVIKT